MKKAKKILTLVACAVLLVCISVGATLAYLQAQTNTVQNTFTVGKVTFDDDDPTDDINNGIDEALVNEYGEPIAEDKEDAKVVAEDEAPRVAGNDYKLIPGHTYTKDPTINIGSDSEDCYIRAFVEVTAFDTLYGIMGNTDDDADMELTQDEVAALVATFVGGYNVDTDAANWYDWGWVISEDGKTVTYEFRYDTIVSKNAEVELFKTITVPGTMSVEDVKALVDADFQINVYAHAIQADGFVATTDEVTGEVTTAADNAWLAWENEI